MLPAAGQAHWGLEIRSDRQDLRDALAPLAHERSWLTVTAERAVSRAMGGNCSMPLAAHGQWNGDQLRLQAAWGDMEASCPWCAPRARPVCARWTKPTPWVWPWPPGCARPAPWRPAEWRRAPSSPARAQAAQWVADLQARRALRPAPCR